MINPIMDSSKEGRRDVRTVTVLTADGPMDIHEATPRTAPRGAVIVVQEAYGVNGHIQDVCERFAAEGWYTVAPHFFHRTGDQVFDYGTPFDEIRPAVAALTAQGVLADLDATRQHLDSIGLPDERTAVAGFCMGGSAAFYAAVYRRLGAAVTFYGGGVASGRWGFAPMPEVAPKLRTPWLGLYGDLDASIPVEEVEALREAAGRSQVPTGVVRYAEAGHGFHCDGRGAYVEAAARDAWSLTLDWLGKNIR